MTNSAFFLICTLLIIGVFLVFASCCEKDNDNDPVFNSKLTYGTMTDQDGTKYKTVTIGTQTWMAENLRTTTYNDGSAIPNVTDHDKWKHITYGAFCNYNNTTNIDTIATYGRLYNWDAVHTGKLAPSGWHVPTDAEWTTLTNYLGGDSVAAGKLKETGTTHWDHPNVDATNETGFTALPGGYRSQYGNFDGIGSYGSWWSATKSTSLNALHRHIDTELNYFYRINYSSALGLSVRCLRD